MTDADDSDYLHPSDDEIAAASDPMTGSEPMPLPPSMSAPHPWPLEADIDWMGDAGVGRRQIAQQVAWTNERCGRGYATAMPPMVGDQCGAGRMARREHGIELLLDRGAVEQDELATKLAELIEHAQRLGFTPRGWNVNG